VPVKGLSKTQRAIRAERLDLEDEKQALQMESARKQLALLKRQQRAMQARDDFMTFVKFTSPDPEDPNDIDRSRYKDAKHHRAIAKVIEEVEKGEITFLILTMPPRHGKSELVSRRLPAWYLGRHPEENVVVATYNDDFAKDFGADVRGIVTSSAYKQVFPDTKLQRGGSAKDRLQTTRGGMGTFVGLGGSLTGRGAHLLVVDDVIRSYEEAKSKTYRDRAWDWFTKVALTRRMGRKLVIITFTRWHEDDIIGRLTDPNNEHYSHRLAKKIKIIDLPAVAGPDDPLGRKEGAALWPDGPDKFDLDFLEDLRAVDPLGFEALYQQRPSVADGVLFRREHIRYYDPADLPDGLRIYCASDHAVTTNQRSDSTVLLKVGVDKQNNIYLLDCWWRKARTPEVVEAMLEMARSGEAPLVWWAERGHITQSIGPFLRKRMAETSTFINIVDVTPVNDKEQRAQSISARMAMGYVHFPKDKPWVGPAVEQLMAFPNGKHDDFVDTLAWVGLGLRNMVPGSPARHGNKPPRFGTLNWVKEAQRQDEMRLNLASTGGF
jgi:predicted phage terminase large subunit-like protein